MKIKPMPYRPKKDEPFVSDYAPFLIPPEFAAFCEELSNNKRHKLMWHDTVWGPLAVIAERQRMFRERFNNG